MKQLKKLASVFFLGFLFISLAACSLEGPGQGGTNSGSGSDSDSLTIGLSVSTLNNPFFVALRDGVIAEAEANGINVEIVDAQDDAAKQVNDVEDLLTAGVDILIINPTDSAAIATAVESANAQGVPVITLDRSSDGGDVVTFIASDNVAGGEQAAQFIIDQLGENATVVELQGIPGASATRERGQGFNNLAASLNIVASQSANFDRGEGLNVMENILQAQPDVAAVFAHNDEMALGALEAINASGRDIMVIGFDGNDDALASISNGGMAATVAQQPDVMGQLAVQTALQIHNGETPQAQISAPLRLVTE
ncbi:MAG: D-ribose ABC transporter substrate-binding protein [Turicibacter sp.]|nr:D-ribose ABC transporter substrate-binding protein [Turicibacter sp.]